MYLLNWISLNQRIRTALKRLIKVIDQGTGNVIYCRFVSMCFTILILLFFPRYLGTLPHYCKWLMTEERYSVTRLKFLRL